MLGRRKYQVDDTTRAEVGDRAANAMQVQAQPWTRRSVRNRDVRAARRLAAIKARRQ